MTMGQGYEMDDLDRRANQVRPAVPTKCAPPCLGWTNTSRAATGHGTSTRKTPG